VKALRFNSFGDVSVLRVEELPTPAPGPDEVLVQVHASSINPSDVKNVQGKMKQITLPRTPGQDFAGWRRCGFYARRKSRRVHCHSKEGCPAEAKVAVHDRGG
jgi:hypothetical protein